MMFDISIHALRGEGDIDNLLKEMVGEISIHALRGEGDYFPYIEEGARGRISIHALRGEGDNSGTARQGFQPFQSTPSVGRATSRP